VRIVVGSVTCSGTLFEEDRVLTAHHCVSARNKYGDFEKRNVPAREVRVEFGGDYMPWADIGVRAIVTPPCGYAAGEGDIAVLVLDKKLKGLKTAKLRLDQTPKLGERVEPAGFGRCGLSTDAIKRRDRAGGKVDKIYESRFRTDAAICPGDSGGPAFDDKTGEVVGIISAAAMDGSESTLDRAEFTRIDRWRAVFSTAALIADGTSPTEVPPVDGCPAPP
jgi:V8-like Glu-specific endopeptidase